MRSLAISSIDNASQNRKIEDTARPTEPTIPNSGAVAGRFQQIRHTLSQSIWLPHSLTTFAFFILTLAVLCGGLFLHINLSAHITQAQYDIAALEKIHREVERENAEVVAQIAIATSMFDIHAKAIALGYIPVTNKHKNFVAVADIQQSLYGLANAPVQTGTENIAVGSANNGLPTENQGTFSGNALAAGVNDTGVLLVASGAASRDIEATNQQQPSITDSLGSWLREWWSSD